MLEAIYKLDNHPTAENVIDFVRKKDPNIGSGTVYKVLETLVENNLIRKVKTEKGVVRYDGSIENHHHLYCNECEYIGDYHSGKLDRLLNDFFKENKIDNFNIEDITLSITGSFIEHRNIKH